MFCTSFFRCLVACLAAFFFDSGAFLGGAFGGAFLVVTVGGGGGAFGGAFLVITVGGGSGGASLVVSKGSGVFVLLHQLCK